MEPGTRDECDRKPAATWYNNIVPIFNDDSFKPNTIKTLHGWVTIEDIAGMDPRRKLSHRYSGILKRKFDSFKSDYSTSVTRHEASGQGDPDSFPEFSGGKVI